MRIVAWNCNMGLHRKLDRLLALKPDVAIVPECARPEILREKAALFVPKQFQWMSSGLDNKGLGVFALGDYRLEALAGAEPDPALRVMLPLRITGPTTFTLLAVWAFNNSAGIRAADPGPVLRGLDRYAGLLSPGPAVVAGDFNNHPCFDRPNRACNHANTLAAMARLGLSSAYHHAHGIPAGEEPHPTLYWMRHQDKPYHIDYCFISEAWLPRLRGAEIGAFQDWITHSDHMPVLVDIELEPPEQGVANGS